MTRGEADSTESWREMSSVSAPVTESLDVEDETEGEITAATRGPWSWLHPALAAPKQQRALQLLTRRRRP